MRRFLALAIILNWSLCASAYPIGGPTQTKRERREAELKESGRQAQSKTSALDAAWSGLREEIERSFLLEDFSAAEKLSREYLASPVSEKDRREVEYLRALCFLKQRRTVEARAILENLAVQASSTRERERILASIEKTKPRV